MAAYQVFVQSDIQAELRALPHGSYESLEDVAAARANLWVEATHGTALAVTSVRRVAEYRLASVADVLGLEPIQSVLLFEVEGEVL